MSWGNQGNPVHSNPSTNQLTEKKHSMRKTPYRPLERTEPLLKKAGWKTEAQLICKKKYSEEKGAQPSINENKNHYDYEKEAG